MTNRPTTRAAITTTLALSLAAAAGCEYYPVTAIATAPGYMAAGAIGGLAVGSTIAYAGDHGPSVTIINNTDIPMHTRVWCAKIDVSKPIGYRDLQTADHLARPVPPGEQFKFQAGRPGWITGMNDGLVWIRLIPEGMEDTLEPVWFSLERPGAYHVEIHGNFDPTLPDSGLMYAGLEGTKMSPLPRSGWIETHDGQYPAGEGVW